MRHLNFSHSAALMLLLSTTGAWTVSAADNASSEGYQIECHAELTMNAGTGDFAPYYIASNRHGIITQSATALIDAGFNRDMEAGKRFTYGFGADFIINRSSATDYLRYNADTQLFETNPQRAGDAWVQQFYVDLKYRGVFLTAGLKEHSSGMLNFALSSGDLVESGNSRPIPEVRVGFIDFQNIPFTGGWLQIQGEISYGKLTDNRWLENHYNYYNYHLNTGALYTYKRCYFRTNPDKPFSATFGMQAAGQFGGTTRWYSRGKLEREQTFSRGIKQFFKMFFPIDGGLSYYSGSSLGSWDVMFRYRFRCGSSLKAYVQKPFEDGSGIGWLNGFDGVWGVEYDSGRRNLISGAVVEYLDFTNQSGPFHWDPDDHPGTTVTNRAEGADDYYNNTEYNAYAYYGMAIGSPALVSPIYDCDGTLRFLYNRLRGFHAGVQGCISSDLKYRLLCGYRKSWGMGYVPLLEPAHTTSAMLEATYSLPQIKGLNIRAQLAFDRGEIYGNNFGGCISISYAGNFFLH